MGIAHFVAAYGALFMNKKDYERWMPIKSKIHNNAGRVEFKERDIFWISVGENIGFEEDGKNALFNRPVLVPYGLTT